MIVVQRISGVRGLNVGVPLGERNIGQDTVVGHARQQHIGAIGAAECERQVRLVEAALTAGIVDEKDPAQTGSSQRTSTGESGCPGITLNTRRTSR